MHVKDKEAEVEVEQVKPEKEPSSQKKRKIRSDGKLQTINENNENDPCMY